MQVAMALTAQTARTLSLVCVTIVLFQALLMYTHRKRRSEIRMIDMREVLQNTATSPSCDIPDDGRGVRVGPSTIHGNGVFATKQYLPNDLIEVCPLIWVPINAQVALSWYFFRDPRHPDGGTIALGYGSLYNHSSTSNAVAVFPGDGTMMIHATETIEVGDEVVIDYGPNYWRLMSEIDAMIKSRDRSVSGKPKNKGEKDRSTDDPHDKHPSDD